MTLDPNTQLSFYHISSYNDWDNKMKALDYSNKGYEANGIASMAGTPEIKANSVVFINETKQIWHGGQYFSNDYPTIVLKTQGYKPDRVPGLVETFGNQDASFYKNNLNNIKLIKQLWPKVNAILLALPNGALVNNLNDTNHIDYVHLSYANNTSGKIILSGICTAYDYNSNIKTYTVIYDSTKTGTEQLTLSYNLANNTVIDSGNDNSVKIKNKENSNDIVYVELSATSTANNLTLYAKNELLNGNQAGKISLMAYKTEIGCEEFSIGASWNPNINTTVYGTSTFLGKPTFEDTAIFKKPILETYNISSTISGMKQYCKLWSFNDNNLIGAVIKCYILAPSYGGFAEIDIIKPYSYLTSIKYNRLLGFSSMEIDDIVYVSSTKTIYVKFNDASPTSSILILSNYLDIIVENFKTSVASVTSSSSLKNKHNLASLQNGNIGQIYSMAF